MGEPEKEIAVFENIPTYVIVLGIFEIVIVPLLVWNGHKLSKISKNLEKCTASLTLANESLAKVLDEIGDAEIRSVKIEGRLKGIDSRLDRIER